MTSLGTTKRAVEMRTLAICDRLRDLSDENRPHSERSSWWDYIPLGVLFLCLLVLDTETWTQRKLLCILTLAAAFLLWFGRRLLAPAQEAEFRNKMVVREADIRGGKVRIFDDASIELQTTHGTRWFRSFAELECSLRARDGRKPPTSELGQSAPSGPALEADFR